MKKFQLSSKKEMSKTSEVEPKEPKTHKVPRLFKKEKAPKEPKAPKEKLDMKKIPARFVQFIKRAGVKSLEKEKKISNALMKFFSVSVILIIVLGVVSYVMASKAVTTRYENAVKSASSSMATSM